MPLRSSTYWVKHLPKNTLGCSHCFSFELFNQWQSWWLINLFLSDNQWQSCWLIDLFLSDTDHFSDVVQGIEEGLHKHPLHVILVAPNQEEFDKVFQLAKAEKNWKEQTHVLTLWGNSKSIFMLLSLSLSVCLSLSWNIYFSLCHRNFDSH